MSLRRLHLAASVADLNGEAVLPRAGERHGDVHVHHVVCAAGCTVLCVHSRRGFLLPLLAGCARRPCAHHPPWPCNTNCCLSELNFKVPTTSRDAIL